MGKYFSMGEMMRSQTADAMGISNKCNIEQAGNIQRLIAEVLDPLREAYGKPIRVTSGFRSPELNKAVGGSRTSDHMTGCAADIVGTPITKSENKKLFELVQELGLSYDQLIDEKGFRWVHVSFRSKETNRMMILHL